MLYPIVTAYTGSLTSPVYIDAGNYYTEVGDRSRFWKIDDYLYCIIGTGSSAVKFYSSDDNGASWVAASAGVSLDNISPYTYSRFCFDAVYRESDNTFHLVKGTAGSSFGARTLCYANASVSSGWIEIGTWIKLVDGNIDNFYGCYSTNIALMNGYPIFVSSDNRQAGSNHSLNVYFATTLNPSSVSDFTCQYVNQPLANAFLTTDIQPINSSAAFVIVNDFEANGALWGYSVDISGGFGSIQQVSSRSVWDREDINGYHMTCWCIASDYTEDNTDYADDLYLAYIGTDEHLYAEFYTISTDANTEDTDVYDYSPSWTYAPRYSVAIKDGLNYWIFIENNTDTSNAEIDVWERDKTDTYTLYDDIITDISWTSSGCSGFWIGFEVYSQKIGLIYSGDDLLGGNCFVWLDAYGEPEPTPTPTPPPERVDEWLAELFSENFAFILAIFGVIMIFFGGFWGIHSVREREIKQAVNGLVILIVGAALSLGWVLSG